MIWPGVVWYGLVWSNMARSGVAWYGVAWYDGMPLSGLARPISVVWRGLACWYGLFKAVLRARKA